MRDRLLLSLFLAGLVALLLACAPGFDQPIQPAWQCPTATPEATHIVGYDPTPADLTVTPGQEPTPGPIFSTPMPTATPYVIQGSDYYQGQRITAGPLTVMVTSYGSQAGPSATEAYHRVTIQIENTSGEPLPILFDLAVIRTLKTPDGRTIQGQWTHSTEAARALGYPATDPSLTRQADGTITGGYPPGTTTRTLVFIAPPGAAQSWGTQVTDAPGSQVWVLLRPDPHCTAAGGSPSDGGEIPPAGTPRIGAGGWPVPPDTPISRGYGCASFYTGTRGPGCPADAPWWHDGIDWAAPVGTPLYAIADLQIQYAGNDTGTMDCSWIDGSQPPHSGFGRYVKATDAQGYTVWYGHASQLLTSAGASVPRGQEVARMGSTGCSTGSHLHFRVRRNGVDINPLAILSR